MTATDRIDWHTGTWRATRRNALLTVTRADGGSLTRDEAIALGLRWATWARDPDLYAVQLDQSVLAMEVGHAEADAGPAVAELIWRLECFSKPTLAIADQPVGDLGWALALAGTHRAVGPGFQYRSTALRSSRLPPGNLVKAVARRGIDDGVAVLDGSLALASAAAVERGLATHVLASAAMRDVVDGLADAEPIDPLLDARSQTGAPHTAQPAKTVERRPGPDVSPLARWALTDVLDLPVDQAIATICRLDEAVRRLGATAPRRELLEARASISVSLPTRRALQALRSR